MPRCSICSDLKVAPEASALLRTGGKVVYLWSGESCGQGFVSRPRYCDTWRPPTTRPSGFIPDLIGAIMPA
jgi:hypothetical protein